MRLASIETSPIWKDVKSIIFSDTPNTKYSYRGMLHTSDYDVKIFKIKLIQKSRHYMTRVADHTVVVFTMTLADYIFKLTPFKDNLEFSLKRIKINSDSLQQNTGGVILTERFKAVYMPKHNKNYAGTDTSFLSYDVLSNELVDVYLELHNRSFELLRTKTVPGIVLQNKSQQDIIESILQGESDKVRIDGKSSIDAVDIVEPDNPDLRQHTVLPNFTRLTDLPTYLQEKSGGVYGSGIGTYFQVYEGKRTWFVYPLYDSRRFKKSKKKAIFYIVPSQKLTGASKLHKKDGDTLYVVCSAEKEYKDNADVPFMNEGVGFRMTDARAFMKKPVDISTGEPISKRTQLHHEVSIKDRKDGNNVTYIAKNEISDNPFVEFSKLAARNMSVVQIKWENADYDLIYPGMPCKYVAVVDNKLVELFGTILQVDIIEELIGTTVTGVGFGNAAMVSVAVDTLSKTPTQINDISYGKY
jgi:hypothetical protein